MESNATFDILWYMPAIESADGEAEQSSSGLGPTAWAPVESPLGASGTKVAYVGPEFELRGVTSVRANHPVPHDCQVYYFEVEVVGRDSEDGVVAVGFAADGVILQSRAPGWEYNSCGYHGDDGKAFSGGGIGQPYGPCFGTGDWVGVVLNRAEGTVSFSRNGVDLGVACEGIPAGLELFPVVGLRMQGDEVDANFGCDLANRPFKGSPASIQQEPLSRVFSRTLHARLPGAQLCPDSAQSRRAQQHPLTDATGCWLAPASLLHWAVQHARPPPCLDAPLPEALETESIDQEHRTPLLLAAGNGDGEWVEALVRMGANVQAATRMGQTALVLSAAAGQERAIQALLAAGAEVNPPNVFAEGSPLTTAASHGRLGAVRLLAAAGADLEAWDRGRTAVMCAAAGGHVDVVEALVELGANPAEADHRGCTALHHFVARYAVWGRPQTPQLLRALLAALGAGAAVRAQLFQSWPTPLDHLVLHRPLIGMCGHLPELIRMLAEAGCPVNHTLPPARPIHGPTLLSWLQRLVNLPGAWPHHCPSQTLAVAAALLQCAAQQAATEDTTPAGSAGQAEGSCALLLLAAIRAGSGELVRMVAEAFPQSIRAGRAVGTSLDCLLQELRRLHAPEEAWEEQHAAPVLGWCQLVQALLELGCSPLTVVVDKIAAPPGPVPIRYSGTSAHLPDWAADPLRELLPVVAAGSAWSEDRHAAFPPAFREAARALLLVSHRLSQERVAPALSGDVIRCILQLAVGGASVLPEWVPPLRPFATAASTE